MQDQHSHSNSHKKNSRICSRTTNIFLQAICYNQAIAKFKDKQQLTTKMLNTNEGAQSCNKGKIQSITYFQ